MQRRNRELGRILVAMEDASARDGLEQLTRRAAHDARNAFGLIDARVLLVDPSSIATKVPVPGDPRPIRSELRTGRRGPRRAVRPAARDAAVGARRTRTCSSCSRASRGRDPQRPAVRAGGGAERPARELDAAKDEFLRGVSATTCRRRCQIRAYAEQLGDDRPDRRLGIITEQAERLSRMVRQLPDRDPAGVRGLQSEGRRRGVRRAGAGARGRGSAPTAWRSTSTTARTAGSPSPTRTSSTRCCGRCWTTP